MIKLGSHISFKKPYYLPGAVDESLKNKANTMMIFLGAPQTTRRVPVENYKLNEYKQMFLDIVKPEDIIVHAPYIINNASIAKHEFSNKFLIEEINRVRYIGAKYLVLHPGSHTTFSRQASIEQLIESLKYVISQTQDVVICIETMAGKGTEIGTTFEELVYIVEQVNSERIAICLDTCHIWDAGYNLHNYDDFIAKIKKSGLLKYLKVIHLNDSLNHLGSKRDRHANIGQGKIGLEALKKIVHDPLFDSIPIILETPWVDNKPIYDKEIAILLEK
ncbi:putative endonuclease 4 [Mesomycoplasma conjunctivae]|uniref:Probable endonuclease 4 n=1 Tax=Mesomycoplasma conjunctivae (strain ATCC 25834 / NCTC 10147 / HRC/581) TaxID=572263 RepID=C5J5R4_MESCH|nr:deoxyribonuclease IV [Mesomycoplasma conjunctivae]CAT04799.1 Probable endonuclease 4 [Mesomycoplasma conjunctivae]VEU65823.1 putative endonuclease 4 [Mesomycoplasma conjunctivae]